MKRELHKASIRWILQIKNKMPIFLFYRNVKLLIVTTTVIQSWNTYSSKSRYLTYGLF